MDTELKEIVIAALLHDVGKFAQRAGIKEFNNKELESVYCKLQEGGWYSHQHVIYTQGFLEKHRDVLPDGINIANVIKLAAKHHSPSEYGEWIVAQGDRLSSGADRCNILGLEASKNENLENDNPSKFYEKPMFHILSTLTLEESSESKKAYCKTQALDEDAILCTQDKKIGKEDYARLWKEFENDFCTLKNLSYDDFVSALNSLLERYWWCIPSATNSDADISLYQHAKTTAAFSASLYNFQKECGEESENALQKNDEKKFRFIKGDISGIQKYIFDLKSNNESAKILRAKSFEITALGEIISKYIVKSFNLPEENIITSAGGNFMILLPNSEKVKNILPQVQLEIETFFLKEYAGKLSVIISDGIEACANDILQKNAQKLINEIGEDADRAKQKKMQKALQKNGAVLEDFYSRLQTNGECVKCGIFPAEVKGGECDHCKALTKLGGNLVRKSYITYKTDKLTSFKEMVFASHEKKENSASINNYVAGLPLIYLPYVAPKKEDGELLSFEEIAEKSLGNKKIAMFKADIDNLGLIFSSSLGKRMSFSRYADMSHTLHYFFSVYYTHFIKTHGYEDFIYTVFSGGDDLCILGSWDKVMQFASDFHKEIIKLTNDNKDITLSAGIALANGGTPVGLIAEMAENALEKSKQRNDGAKCKNAITVFGTTVSWEDYEKSLENGTILQRNLAENIISTGVVYKIIDFANRAEKIKGGDVSELVNFNSFTWKSNFKYIVSRNVRDEKLKEWLYQFGTSNEEMIKSRIAVSYALYTQRKN